MNLDLVLLDRDGDGVRELLVRGLSVDTTTGERSPVLGVYRVDVPRGRLRVVVERAPAATWLSKGT